MFSAFVTLIFVVLHYLLDYRNLQNPVDRAVIKFMTPKAWNNQRQPSKKWTQALEAAVIMYSDTQVLTGIAILLSAYIQLSCGISIYHWQVAVDLAWFSSLTHLTTLTSLRAYFRKRPQLAFWRLFLMGVNLLLLVTAMAPTGYISYTYLDYSTPAKCLYSKTSWTAATRYTFRGFANLEEVKIIFNTALVVLTLVFLLTSFGTRSIRLFTPLSKFARRWLRIVPGNFIKSAIQREPLSAAVPKILCHGLQAFLLLVYVFFKAIYEIGESMIWEVCVSNLLVLLCIDPMLILKARFFGSSWHLPGAVYD